MSERPRSHRIADQSRLAFERLLPESWLFTELHKDYGLDGQVEVFDAQGNRTGLQFFVQFKATDKPPKNSPLRIQFSRATGIYYRSLDLPVLVCRYHAASNQFFVRWFHEQQIPPPDQKSLSFQIDADCEWTPSHPLRLIEELRTFRDLRRPGLSLPIKLALTAKRDAKVDFEIASRIRHAAARVPSVVRIVGSVPLHASPEIQFLPSQVKVSLAGITTFAFPRPSPGKQSENFVPDLFLGLAMLLGQLGHYAPAAVLVTEFFAKTSLQHDVEFLWKSMLCLFQARRIHDALVLAEKYSESDTLKSAVFILPAMVGEPPLSESEVAEFLTFLKGRLQRARCARRKVDVAAAYYSLAHFFHSNGDHRKALPLFRRAAIHHPDYQKRAYFWEVFAASHFLVGHFALASKLYARALRAKKPSPMCRAKFADALLYAGEYRKSERQLSRFIRETQEPDSEWCLKALLLSRIRIDLGIVRQVRRTRRAVRLSGVGSLEENTSKSLEKALRADALWGGAWFNLSLESFRLGDYEKALINSICSAICHPSDIESWCRATILCFFDRSRLGALPHVVIEAFRSTGEAYYDTLVGELERLPSSFPSKLAATTVRQIIDASPSRKRLPVSVRLIKRDGEFLELTV
jgi:tetratricopeptide (TPR) repeat protein